MKIRVMIADRPYSISITPEEEEIVRRAAKKINEQIIDTRKRFDAPNIDHLAMAALKISIENEQNRQKYHYSIDRLELEELAKSVDSVLKEK